MKTIPTIILSIAAIALLAPISYSQEKLRTVKNLRPGGYAPIEIMSLEVGGKPSIDASHVLAGPDWLRNLTLSIKNVTDKKISSVYIYIRTGPNATTWIAFPIIFPVVEGNADGLHGVEILRPGEVAKIKVSSDDLARSEAQFKQYKSEDIESVAMEIAEVRFDDASRWVSGEEGLFTRLPPQIQGRVRQSGDVPIVDIEAEGPLSPAEKELRIQRGRKYKTSVPLDKMEDQDAVFHSSGAHSPVDQSLPVDRSDIVVLGTVTDARAFVSNDKTALYSEFQVTVNKIFKNSNGLGIKPGSSIVAEREGGKLRFSSGRIQQRGESGRELPQKNRQYILFLKWDEPGKDFVIITGYEVNGETVQPLDGLTADFLHPFSNYGRHNNADLKMFISELETAISQRTQ